MLRHIIFGAMICVASTHAFADFVSVETPAWQGNAGSSFYGWESFTEAYQAPNWNDSGTPYGAQLFNFGPGAFVTGSGNIYNPVGPSDFHVYGFGSIDQAVLNISTAGTELDYTEIALYVGNDQGGQMLSFDTSSINFYQEIPDQGYIVNASFTWDVSSYSGEITEWGFFFQSTDAHTSLDAVTIDILASGIPTPGALALLAFAAFTRKRRS
jgi:hypothetical protein